MKEVKIEDMIPNKNYLAVEWLRVKLGKWWNR